MGKSIIIFGFGDKGKKIINQCLNYASGVDIIAIADNFFSDNRFRDIPVIDPKDIKQYEYDEIWICTVYFEEIRKQLIEEYNIEPAKIYYEDVVMPVLDERLKKKYAEYVENNPMEYPIEYMLCNRARMYCYPFFDEYLNKKTEVFHDAECGLYYSIYCGKRMYLARSINTEQKARYYVNQMLMEQDSRCPHCYWNFDKLSDVVGSVVDVGTAEGIFGLKIIEQVEHLYMIEVDEEWIEALSKTYARYMEKVTIIKKLASSFDDSENIKLDTLFQNINIAAIKMDIEGMELEALTGAKNIICKNNLLLAICTYHHEEDNKKIGEFLKGIGYRCSNSEGWVICQGEWELDREETGFRRALIFAEKRSV
ncbi:MAG: FkbM family methyltransferase [Alphaproteobacteria bacterium]|nr:FkbM family methyltransferase [Alphaproteobacteria bacterium]MBQ6888567.1 FkbM family methyltransferase [Lachnospiraceae bacterium]